MKLITIIPTIFYEDARVGIDLFTNALGFAVLYQETNNEHPLHILGRENLRLHIVQDAESAQKDRPEIRIETDDITTLYASVLEQAPRLLHPNLKQIRMQPWGLQEFALLDSSGVCVIVQQ